MNDLSRSKLSDDQIRTGLETLQGWSAEGGVLKRTLEFEQYKDGLAFVSAVGWLADSLDHHPDLALGYRKLTITLSTHDADGITAWDFELARRIDALQNWPA